MNLNSQKLISLVKNSIYSGIFGTISFVAFCSGTLNLAT